MRSGDAAEGVSRRKSLRGAHTYFDLNLVRRNEKPGKPTDCCWFQQAHFDRSSREEFFIVHLILLVPSWTNWQYACLSYWVITGCFHPINILDFQHFGAGFVGFFMYADLYAYIEQNSILNPNEVPLGYIENPRGHRLLFSCFIIHANHNKKGFGKNISKAEVCHDPLLYY